MGTRVPLQRRGTQEPTSRASSLSPVVVHAISDGMPGGTTNLGSRIPGVGYVDSLPEAPYQGSHGIHWQYGVHTPKPLGTHRSVSQVLEAFKQNRPKNELLGVLSHKLRNLPTPDPQFACIPIGPRRAGCRMPPDGSHHRDNRDAADSLS